MYKTLLLILFLSFVSAVLSAQQDRKVNGLVLASSEYDQSKKALPYASVVILNVKDSTFIKGVVTDTNGIFNFSLPEQKNKQFLMKVSFTGYTSVYRTLEENTKDINAGTITLEEADVELEQVTITAQMPELELKGDTTVINVSAYKTPEGSYLEELVKRIPGLEYDKQEKKLTYNGLPINEINLNGEAFFSGDKEMVLENLPANVISKIKVYDKKSELEKITGVKNSGKENYVLDLQTKKEFGGTLVGSAKAGHGNHNKKDYELQGNYFKENGENFSLITRSTNLMMMSSNKENIQHWISTNFAKKFKDKLTLNGNIGYNYYKAGNNSTSYNEQYLTSQNNYSYSANENMNKNRMITAALGMRWEISKKTFFNFYGNFNSGRGNSTANNHQATFSQNPGIDVSNPFPDIQQQIPDEIKINNILMNSLNGNQNDQYSLSSDFTHILNEKGTSISITLQHSENKREDENFILSSTTYYQLKNSMGNDSILYRNQYLLSPSKNQNESLGMLLTHPFTQKLRLQLSYNFNYSRERNNRNTYDLSSLVEENTAIGFLPDNYEAGYTDSLSNKSNSHTLGHDITMRMNYSTERWDINAELSIQPEKRKIEQKTGLLQADTISNHVGFRPSASISWKKEKNVIRLNYNGSTRQPALTDLLSLTDNSDPLNIRRGNPHLKPAFNQNIRLETQNASKGIFASLNWSGEINSQTVSVSYDTKTGGQETYPVNINGNWNLNGMLRYQKRIKKFNISANGGGSYRENVSLINEQKNEQPDRSTTRNQQLNTNLRLSYLPEWGNIDINGNWRFNHSANSLRQTNTYTRNYTLGLNMFAKLPGNIELKTDAVYSFRNGTNIQKGKDDQFVWNAGITWRFLKKKEAELSVYYADILSKKKNYNRNTTANGFYEFHSQQISSYFIVSVKYRINKILRLQN